jgi:elongation factor 1-gamma
LYTYPENFRAYKVQIAAEYSGCKLKVVSEPPEFVLGQTNTTPEFLSKFPFGQVPAFETPDGTPIYQSNAIAYYVSSPTLRGTNDLDTSLILQYVLMADNELLPPLCTWVFPTLGLMPYNKEATRQAQETLKKYLGNLNDILSTRTFLVGERVTLADIAVVCTLLSAYQQVFDPEYRAPFVHVNRWFVTCVNQPQFRAVLGDVVLCEKMAQFDAKKYNELFPKEKKEKKKEEKKPVAPKEPQKKKEKNVALEPPQDEEEEEEAPKPKFVDPYISLPKSTFSLDGFKKSFCNEDIDTKAIPYLWDNFDKEGWSIWRSDYNYNDDLNMIFMSSNLVSGMFQRLEKLHKYGFAIVYILGQDKNNKISGIWILRGTELAFDLCEDWNIDAPSYTFTKLDSDDPNVREYVNGFMRRDRGDLFNLELNGKAEELPIRDLKIFK